MENTMKVKAIWEFEVDTEDLMEEFVDIKGLAKDLTQREIEYLLENKEISAEDFSYELETENNLHMYRKILVTDGMSNDLLLFMTDAPMGKVVEFMIKVKKAVDNGDSTTELYEGFKAEWLFKVLLDMKTLVAVFSTMQLLMKRKLQKKQKQFVKALLENSLTIVA